ncbi:hypothetical protein GS399_18080 [Pedobacter sp. HMF7647]|uniref:Putative carbohydrate metabolism domain-containing protein n=1 Tax=Hufsiella arboris TaxID=2695275 RepID=A0A7K1YE55_9SPHI|nr:PCMD domain-containing protein [Hufsiella arboris]MXV52886.1 hypothetical protein [Hufsiella arboris]
MGNRNKTLNHLIKRLLLFVTIFFAVSCIKDAPLNPEADIEVFTIDPALTTSKTVIDQVNNVIKLYITSEAYDQGVAPSITVSKGAGIAPASGDSIHPKDKQVQYTVTSENGVNKKIYTVEVVNVGDWSFDFEVWQQNADDKYEFPVESGNVELWTSGNPGVALAGVEQRRDAYPTRFTSDAYSGKGAAEMVTIKGTFLSDFVGAYIFAGSLFLGDFNPEFALANPLQATEFGEPYVGLPKSFTGYYKYTPGPVFQDENQNPVSGKTDQCAIYAVLYEGPDKLNATNIHTSDRIIATATLPDGSAKSSFTRFDIPFTYIQGRDPAGKNLLMAIVASSSVEGDHYRGAIGSKLVVDSLAIVPK